MKSSELNRNYRFSFSSRKKKIINTIPHACIHPLNVLLPHDILPSKKSSSKIKAKALFVVVFFTSLESNKKLN